MIDATWRPTLGEHFLTEMPTDALRKKRFGGYEVLAGEAVFGTAWVFHRAAILGRARADRLDGLAELLRLRRSPSGQPKPIDEALKAVAVETVAQVKTAPRSLLDYWLLTELPSADWSEAALVRLRTASVPLAAVLSGANAAAAAGLAFGAAYPQAVEVLWSDAQHQAGPGPWSRAQRAGVPLTDRPERMSLATAEKSVLEDVATFVAAHYPQLLEPLKLVAPV